MNQTMLSRIRVRRCIESIHRDSFIRCLDIAPDDIEFTNVRLSAYSLLNLVPSAPSSCELYGFVLVDHEAGF
jgi:hypothetical protein